LCMALSFHPALADPPPGSPMGPPAPPLDSLRVPANPDTTQAQIVEVGRTRTTARRVPAPTPPFGEPKWVMMRSLVVPGWGQLYNGSWLKAGLFAGIEGMLIGGLVGDEQKLNRLSRQADEAQANHDEDAFNVAVSAYNDRLAESINRRWLLGAAIVYSVVDAYVDAHFRNFPVEFGPDPALPPELAPSGKGKNKGHGGGRMSLRWTF
jgi:hypothetical protein